MINTAVKMNLESGSHIITVPKLLLILATLSLVKISVRRVLTLTFSPIKKCVRSCLKPVDF